MAKLTVHQPNVPEGELVEVPPYGLIKNGDTIEVEALEEDLVIGDTSVKLSTTSVPSPDPRVESQEMQEASAGQQGAEPTGLREPPVKGEDTAAGDQVTTPDKATAAKKAASKEETS